MDKNTKFWFDGKDSEQMGIKLQSPVTITGAIPRLERVSVPGRNGDIIYFDGSYDNRSGVASCFALKKHNVMQNVTRINNWLLSSYEYKELVIPEDKDHFFLASVTNGAEINTRLSMLAPFNINFTCRPERFLRSGKKEILLQDGFIVNPTQFPAYPLIVFSTLDETPIGEIDVLFGNYSIYAESIEESQLIFDAETCNAYMADLSFNNQISVSTDFKIEPGNVNFANLNSRVVVTMIPRWWEL